MTVLLILPLEILLNVLLEALMLGWVVPLGMRSEVRLVASLDARLVALLVLIANLAVDSTSEVSLVVLLEVLFGTRT